MYVLCVFWGVLRLSRLTFPSLTMTRRRPPPAARRPPPQSVYEDVARDTNRGHTVAAVKDCFVLAKDAGFKVGRHEPPNPPADFIKNGPAPPGRPLSPALRGRPLSSQGAPFPASFFVRRGDEQHPAGRS